MQSFHVWVHLDVDVKLRRQRVREVIIYWIMTSMNLHEPLYVDSFVVMPQPQSLWTGFSGQGKTDWLTHGGVTAQSWCDHRTAQSPPCHHNPQCSELRLFPTKREIKLELWLARTHQVTRTSSRCNITQQFSSLFSACFPRAPPVFPWMFNWKMILSPVHL